MLAGEAKSLLVRSRNWALIVHDILLDCWRRQTLQKVKTSGIELVFCFSKTIVACLRTLSASSDLSNFRLSRNSCWTSTGLELWRGFLRNYWLLYPAHSFPFSRRFLVGIKENDLKNAKSSHKNVKPWNTSIILLKNVKQNEKRRGNGGDFTFHGFDILWFIKISICSSLSLFKLDSSGRGGGRNFRIIFMTFIIFVPPLLSGPEIITRLGLGERKELSGGRTECTCDRLWSDHPPNYRQVLEKKSDPAEHVYTNYLIILLAADTNKAMIHTEEKWIFKSSRKFTGGATNIARHVAEKCINNVGRPLVRRWHNVRRYLKRWARRLRHGVPKVQENEEGEKGTRLEGREQSSWPCNPT